MRERVTFVQPKGAGVDPQTLQVQAAGLLGPVVETVREDRLTLTIDELPSDLSELVSGLSELHIRWAAPTPYNTLEPFASRISPGFHLSYSPAKASPDPEPSKLCEYLNRFGKLNCSSQQAFTSSGEPEASSKTPFFYFYQQLEDLHALSLSALRDLCDELDTICHARVRALHTASSLDISWDVASSKLKLTALWPLTEQSINVPQSASRRTEVGVLAQDVPPSMQSHEVGVSGLLTVLGETQEPSPTLFAFPARHRAAAGTFSSKFVTPTGLHPSLQLSLESVTRPEHDDESCKLFSYLTLPSTIFADRYQLSDDLFLASKNLTSLRHTTLPVDLEAPAYTTAVWGSSILLELSPREKSWSAEVPLHLRYLRPSITGHVDIEMPYPALFWACDSDADASFDTNPFDRKNIGYDVLFDDKTVFWHVAAKPSHPAQQRLVNEIKVPVLKEDAASWVEVGTGAAVSLGFAWVLWVLFRAMMQPSIKVDAASQSQKKN